MPVIQVRVGNKLYDDIVKAFGDLGQQLETAFDQSLHRVAPVMLQSLHRISNELAKKHGAGWNGQVVNPTNTLQSRTGRGLKDIRDSIRISANNDQIVAGEISGASLSFHEEGGTIRAKSAKYLTIPLPAAMDPRGVPLRARARQWDYTFVKKSRKGNLIIFRRIPGARELTPLYILKTSVYIRPRLGMEPVVLSEMGYFENKLFEEISDTIDAALGA